MLLDNHQICRARTPNFQGITRFSCFWIDDFLTYLEYDVPITMLSTIRGADRNHDFCADVVCASNRDRENRERESTRLRDLNLKM
jgi:hypothetical protein